MNTLTISAALLALGAVGLSRLGPDQPKVGEPAPTFRLNDHSGQTVQLGGEQPRWTVLAFYPKAMTPG